MEPQLSHVPKDRSAHTMIGGGLWSGKGLSCCHVVTASAILNALPVERQEHCCAPWLAQCEARPPQGTHVE